jgi:hypothetical protein
MPLESCFKQRVSGVALPGSYIDFENFGSAGQPALLAEDRELVENDFKVLFGQRVRASFHLILGDQRVTTALHDRDVVPLPTIGGVIDGFFDFDLDRTRAAQPFP